MVASHRAGVIELFVLAHRRHQARRLGAQASSISAAPVEAADYLPGVTKVVVLAQRCYQALRPHTQASLSFSTWLTVSTGESNDCIVTYVSMVPK